MVNVEWRCVGVGFKVEGSEESFSRVTNRSRVEECSSLLQCSLSQNRGKDCRWDRNLICVDRMKEVCS